MIDKKENKPMFGSQVFRNAKVTVKQMNYVIFIGILALILATIFLVKNGGFTVSYQVYGGTTVESQELKYGDLIPEPKAPTRECYTFGGWYTDEEYTKQWNFLENKVEGDTTLHARWIPEG